MTKNYIQSENKIESASFNFLKWLWLITIAATFLGASLRFGDIVFYHHLLIYHFLFFCVFIIVFSYNLFKDLKKQIMVKNYMYFLLIWYICACISVIWALYKSNVSTNIMLLTKDFSLIFFTVFYTRKTEDFKRYLKVSVLLYMLIVFFAIYESLSGNHLAISRLYLKSFKPNQPYKYIPTSFFYNENDLATVIVLYIPMFYYLFKHFKSIAIRIFSIFMIFVGVIVLLMTGCRACIISLVMQIGILLIIAFCDFIKKRKTWILGTVLSVMLIALLMTDGFHIMKTIGNHLNINLNGNVYDLNSISEEHDTQSGSVFWRENLIKNGLIILKRSHYIGVGAGNIERYMPYYNKHYYYTHGALDMHNWWFEVLVDYGVPIFIMYLFFYFSLVLILYRMCFKGKNDKQKNIAEIFLMSMLSFSTAFISSGSIISSYAVWILLGFIIAFINYTRIENNKNRISNGKVFIIGDPESIESISASENFIKSGYDVANSFTSKNMNLINMFKEYRKIRKINPDIVFGQHILSDRFYNFLFGKKKILKISGSDLVKYQTLPFYKKYLVDALLSRADLIICETNNAAVALINRGINKNKIITADSDIFIIDS